MAEFMELAGALGHHYRRLLVGIVRAYLELLKEATS